MDAVPYFNSKVGMLFYVNLFSTVFYFLQNQHLICYLQSSKFIQVLKDQHGVKSQRKFLVNFDLEVYVAEI